ncbi:MAG TPA: coenzyme F420-0:L-glutamate ligase [Candidatus Saccharimonadales bacterium]|jgi:putative folate metabolism gamma-glutamate ligase
MIISAIKTAKIVASQQTLYDVLDTYLPVVTEKSIVVITSKIVSICEGSIVPYDDISKADLVVRESDLYLPAEASAYGHHFTIVGNTLIAMAGIDESNGEGYYILWPRNSQQTANEVRAHLLRKHNIREVGVVITDSTTRPLRRGTTGISLAHSGFAALNNYIGKPDIFGRPFGVTQANVAEGIAAAAVLAMGEGAEQTPLCVLTDASTVQFENHDPTAEQLAETTLSIETDLFQPFLTTADWRPGGRHKPSIDTTAKD